MSDTTEDRSALDLLRSSRITSYGFGLLSLIAGIVLVAWPDRSVVVVARIIGVLFIVTGFGQAAEALTTHRKGSYWGLLLLRGLINLGIGVALLFIPEKSTNVVVWLIALDFLITGVLALIVTFIIPKGMGRGSMLIQGLIGVVLAFVIWGIGADQVKDIAAVVIGIVLILLGLLFLAAGWQLSKADRELDRR
ncbi:MAG: hypothetical protein FGM58_09200 [Acidimicrobiia bacterium]|nr:hypothetical protein [Acidimicrobiia bacterium]